MSVRALRAANSAAQEARALQANVSKQRQAVTKDSLEQVKRLDAQGHARGLRELQQKRAMAAIDAETARSKALGNAIVSAVAAVGTAVTAAVGIGQRLVDRANAVFNPAEAARLEEEAGRRGGRRLEMAQWKLEQAQKRLEQVQKQVREKEARSWFPGLGPGIDDRQRLERAKLALASAQDDVYAAGGDREIRRPEAQLPPHLQTPPVAGPPSTAHDAPSPEPVTPPDPNAADRDTVPLPGGADTASHPGGASHDASEASGAAPVVNEPGPAVPVTPAGSSESVSPPKNWAEQAEAAVIKAIDDVRQPLEHGIGWFMDVTTGSISFDQVARDVGLSGPQPPSAPPEPLAPAQPAVSAHDGAMPLVKAAPTATAASQWASTGAQPLPLQGTPQEQLHRLLELARKGELTRGMVIANKDLFSAQGLTRLQAGLLADLGAANNGRQPSGALVTAEIQRALDQAHGFGKIGALAPAMRQALLPKAADHLLNAANAFRTDPTSALKRQAYEQARRDYEDLKYGELALDGRVQATGLLHLLSAEMKQAFEPMDIIDPETGQRDGDVIARLLSAVELVRNTTEAAIKEGEAARAADEVANEAAAMIRKAEAEAGMYGIGPGAGGR